MRRLIGSWIVPTEKSPRSAAESLPSVETSESSSVFADAPGYVAVTEMLGGAMLGYWATGKLVMQSTPTTVRMMAILIEKGSVSKS
jgi:hypothetical protein